MIAENANLNAFNRVQSIGIKDKVSNRGLAKKTWAVIEANVKEDAKCPITAKRSD